MISEFSSLSITNESILGKDVEDGLKEFPNEYT